MKTLLRFGMCGSRQWRNAELIYSVMSELKQKHGPYVVVYGAHWEGADRMILMCAERLELEVDAHPADWKKYASPPPRVNPAGQIRNAQMAQSGLTSNFCFRSRGKSPGSDGMVRYCLEAGVLSLIIPENATFAMVRALLGLP